MTPRMQLIGALSVLAFGASGMAGAAEVTSIMQCEALATPQAQEECACQLALQDPDALEQYVQRYPSPSGESACAALALSNLDRPDNDPEPGSSN